ncbi:MAG: addiction module toxin RelE [Prevotella sp.]|nr:addiction module toxin RelE [Prevotella sp.]
MSYEIKPHNNFLIEAKKLKKRYHSFKDDLEDFTKELQKNPLQGAELYPGIRKIRMPIASKGRGKAGGARVITANDVIIAEHEGQIALLAIYDKSDYSTVDVKVIRQMARELGIDM